MKIKVTGEVKHSEDLELRKICEKSIEEKLIQKIIKITELGKTYKLTIECERQPSDVDSNFYKIIFTAKIKEIQKEEAEEAEKENSTCEKIKFIDEKIKKMTEDLKNQLKKYSEAEKGEQE